MFVTNYGWRRVLPGLAASFFLAGGEDFLAVRLAAARLLGAFSFKGVFSFFAEAFSFFVVAFSFFSLFF